jgi:hypothetical protein
MRAIFDAFSDAFKEGISECGRSKSRHSSTLWVIQNPIPRYAQEFVMRDTSAPFPGKACRIL